MKYWVYSATKKTERVVRWDIRVGKRGSEGEGGRHTVHDFISGFKAEFFLVVLD